MRFPRFHMSMKLAFLFLCAGYMAHAQTITVSGRVTGENAEAVPGVNIVEKGTANGTITDVEGYYSLTVDPNAILVLSFLGYKPKEVRVEGESSIDISLTIDVLTHWPVVDVGYGRATMDRIAGATTRLTDDDFNKGNIYDPAQLWQGKVAGLSIYNRGGNPNSESLLRIRGLSTFDPDSRPLIVVDGVPMSTLNNLDPQDIESISVLKDGASAAIYGMRASQGVIIVNTKKGLPGLSVSVQSEAAASTLMRKQPVMNAEEHIAAGGNDLGSSTDWQDEITRTGLSGNLHLAVSGGNQTSSFRIATHIRSVNGILLHSGFDQVNTRVNVRHAALHERLRFDFNFGVNNRESNFSFPEAFRYANIFLPSAPIFFPSGDYYQAITFDNYNPVAMLEQNVNLGRRRNTNYSAKIDFNILDDLTLTVNAGQQFENNFNGTYYSRNSFYIGQQRNGLARRYTDDQSFTLAESYLTWAREAERIRWNIVAGFSYQEDQSESFGAELGDFPSDELGYNAIGYSADILKGQPNLIDIFSTTSPVNTIQAGFLRASMTFNDIVTLNTSLRQEKSNKLGTNQQNGFFPAASASVDLLRVMPNLHASMFKLHVGYGITGSIPTQSGLAQDQYEYSLSTGTVFKVRDANPDLKWEKKNEFNAGIDISKGRFFASYNIYRRKITDLIQQRYVSNGDFTGFRYENVAGLAGRGGELTLGYDVGRWGGVTWQTSVLASLNATSIDYYPVDQETRGFIDAAGFGGTQMIKVAVGERADLIWGPVFDRVDTNGAPVFADVNGDGVVMANPANALDPNGDFAELGYGVPSAEFGWTNKLTFRRWDLNAFFRGALGYSLVNLLRVSFEPADLGNINSYNRVVTDKAVPGLMSGRYSSLYVEDAKFVKLDNVTVGYSFPVKGTSWRVYTTVQNAFVLTGYTGVDPEPSLIDRFPTSPLVPPDPLVPGIDRNGNYSPSRTFLLGLAVRI
jgi:TonB-linked SusC/RagA family outer membrane protein